MRIKTIIIGNFVQKFLYRVKFYNKEILDKYKTYLICPNHSCVFDPAIVFPLEYDKDVFIMAKKELFKHASFRWLAKQYNVFSIDRENVDVRSMLKSLDIFKENDTAKLILFPEGKVIKDEDEVGNVYKKGAIFIATHMQKPIIPVYITRRPKLFHKVDVIFGEPYTISKEDIKGIGKIEDQSKVLIEKIYSLKRSTKE